MFALFRSAPVISAWLLVCAATAAAQGRAATETKWVVVSASHDVLNESQREMVLAIERELAARDVAMIDGASASLRIDERGSRELTQNDEERVRELALAVRELEALVATRQREAALEQAHRVRTLSQSAVDVLSEQRELGRTLLNGCLAESWLYLQMSDEDAARERLEVCRAMHPDVPINVRTTPPPIVRLLQQVDHVLRRRPVQRLTVRTHLPECTLFIQGQPVASGSVLEARLPIGRYRLEVTCPGIEHRRVHSIVVAAEDRTLDLDPRFDAALYTGSDVSLRFAGEMTPDILNEYAWRIGALVEASDVVVISFLHETIRVQRISRTTGTETSAVVRRTEDVPAACDALMAPPSGALENGMARGTNDSDSPAGDELRDAEKDWHIAGWATFATGAAVLAGAWAAFAVWTDAMDTKSRLGPDRLGYYAATQRIEILEWITPSLGGAGAVAMGVGEALALSGTRPPEWWSWTMGAIGLATLGGGIAMIATHGSDARYVAESDSVSSLSTMLLGALLCETSGPLLFVPIVRLLLGANPDARSPVLVDVSVDRLGGSLGVRGTW